MTLDRVRLLRHGGLFAVVSLLLGALPVRGGQLFGLLLPGTIVVLVLLGVVRGLARSSDDPTVVRRITAWTMAAFAIHLAIGLAVTNLNILRTFMGPDSVTYHAGALGIIDHWKHGYPLPFLPSGKEGFYYMLAGVYWFVGPYASAGLVMNAGISAAVVPVVYNLTDRLFGPRAAGYVPPIIVLFPGMLMWTSQLLREAGVILLLAVAANFGVRLSERFTLGRILGLSLALAMLFTYRGYIALAVAGTLVCGVSLGRKQLLAGLGSSASAVAVLAIVVFSLGLGYSGYKIAVDSDLKTVNTFHKDLSLTGASGYDKDVDLSTGGQALSYLPKGSAIVAFGPLPWHLRGLSQMPGLIDVFSWWFLLPRLWWGLGVARRRHERRAAVLILPAVGISLILALAIGNYGTLVRERLQVIVLVVPIVAAGFAAAAERRDQVAVVDGQALPAANDQPAVGRN